MQLLKKAVALLAAFLLLLVGARLTSAATPDAPVAAQTIPDTQGFSVNAKGAVVMDAQTGRVLFAQGANKRLPMASTTKIMTSLLTLEQEGLDDYFTVDGDAIRVEGSSMGLKEGDSVSLRALAYGMLLPSGNDGANAAAVRIAGSKAAFAELMNERAAQIGMEDTHFVTPSGLDDKEHYSTAYDMALLAREALQNPAFADICSQSKAVVQYGNPPYNRWLKNHNRLLRDYEGTVGVKTGFTDTAGRCLVSCAMRGGVKLVVVTLGCPDDWTEHRRLYDHYFGLLRLKEVGETIPELTLPVAGGLSQEAKLCYPEPGQVALMEGEPLEARVVLEPFVFAPVRCGQIVGSITVYCGGQPVKTLELTVGAEVPAKEAKGLWARLRGT